MASARAGGVDIRGEWGAAERTLTLAILQPRMREGGGEELVSEGAQGRADGGDLRYNGPTNQGGPRGNNRNPIREKQKPVLSL